MNCTKCGKENHEGSKFCRFCGANLDSPGKAGMFPKIFFWTLVILIILGGIAYAASKAIDYFNVKGMLSQAQILESTGQYQQASAALALTSAQWTTDSMRNDISLMQQKEQKYSSWKNDYDLAVADIASSSYEEAQTLLQGIDPSYPQYSLVKEKLIEVQKDIQNELNAKITEAQQNAAAQKAAAAAAQKQAKAASDSAAAKAQSAKSEEVMKSFVSQLSTIYKTYTNTGNHYYSLGISENNAGDVNSALIDFTAAETAFSNAQQDAKNLNTNFTGLPQSYVNAASNMEWAAYYSSQAVLSVLSEIKYSTDNSGTVNYYANLSDSYSNLVKQFLLN